MRVVFDIDGTLTRTCGLDAEAWERAFRDTFGVALPTSDWGCYRHATDEGIAHEAHERCFGTALAPAALGALRARLVEVLRDVLPAADEALQVPGAQALLAALRREGHALALATGCWGETARLKLERARLDVGGLVLSAADGEPDRARILAGALERCGAGTAPGDGAVYVGDGPWDVAAARQVGVGFVGVDEERSGRLAALGVAPVLADYRDLAAVRAHLLRHGQRRSTG